jgi:hypothetical protein
LESFLKFFLQFTKVGPTYKERRRGFEEGKESLNIGIKERQERGRLLIGQRLHKTQNHREREREREGGIEGTGDSVKVESCSIFRYFLCVIVTLWFGSFRESFDFLLTFFAL